MSPSLFSLNTGIGPSLPSFNSLLVKGPYHPSAPLHLCISHLQDNTGDVLFFSPSRQALATPLQHFNDEWITTNAAKGQCISLFSRINIYYPPSTAHWLLLLSLFKPLSSSSTQLNKSVLPHRPSLIVLHEPSSYFISADSSQPPTNDLSQYVQLITFAFSTASFLSPQKDKPIPLVLFDSRLGDLNLPIVRPASPSRHLLPTTRPASPVRQERVEKFVEKYFEWIGFVVDEYTGQAPRTPPRQGTFETPTYERRGPFKLRLDRRHPAPAASSSVENENEGGLQNMNNRLTFEWNEVRVDPQPHSAIRQTRIIAKDDEDGQR